jgi:glycine/D-amino acid oxidase-like deaminating enzyme/nitrite reductase/ring-hydroxylating ferredoxin subunit
MNTESYWTKSAELPRHAALADDVNVDVAVIGGGITGITAAYLAKKAGLTVALLERRRLAQVDTGHTTAHLTAVTDLRLHTMERRFGENTVRAVWEAGTAAVTQIAALVQGGSIDCGFHSCPGYLHAAGRDEDAGDLLLEADAARRLGIAAEFQPSVPFFRVPGVCFPNQAIFHPLRYLAGLLRAIPGGGGHVYEETAAEEFDDQSIRTARGRVHFKHLILATHNPLVGGSSLVGATLFQTKLSLYTSYALAARIPGGQIPEGAYWDTADPYHYLRVQKQNGHDLAIYGGEDHKTGQESDTEAVYARLESGLRRFAPSAVVDARWSGQVIETNDGLPFIGWTSPRQFIATGFAGNGMTFGTIGAMMAVGAITGASNPWEKIFDPGRTTVIGGTLSFLKENKDFPVRLLRDRMRKDDGSLRDLAPGEGKTLELHRHKIAAYRDPDGRLSLCSAICTHLQCVVNWNPAEKTWDCPCHGSRFRPDGQVISGPAEAPLPRVSPTTGRRLRPRRAVAAR